MDIEKIYQLIIFDCDGTLVDSEQIACTLIAEMLTEIGIPCTPKESSDLFLGTKFSDIRNYIITHNGQLPSFDFEEEYRKRSKVLFETELTSIEGVEDILENLRIPCCVGSNAPHVKMDISIPACKLDKYFTKDRIFSAYDVQKWKPEPDLFLYACDKMGVPPESAIVIEDSYSGVMGAINANIDVLAYSPHPNPAIEKLGIPIFKKMAVMKKYLEAHGIIR